MATRLQQLFEEFLLAKHTLLHGIQMDLFSLGETQLMES